MSELLLEVPGPIEPDQPMPNPPGEPEIPDPPEQPEPVQAYRAAADSSPALRSSVSSSDS